VSVHCGSHVWSQLLITVQFMIYQPVPTVETTAMSRARTAVTDPSYALEKMTTARNFGSRSARSSERPPNDSPIIATSRASTSGRVNDSQRRRNSTGAGVLDRELATKG
jgi:hypothetical protein